MRFLKQLRLFYELHLFERYSSADGCMACDIEVDGTEKGSCSFHRGYIFEGIKVCVLYWSYDMMGVVTPPFPVNLRLVTFVSGNVLPGALLLKRPQSKQRSLRQPHSLFIIDAVSTDSFTTSSL